MTMKHALRTRGEHAAARLLRTPPLRDTAFRRRRLGPPRLALAMAELTGRHTVLPGTPSSVPDWSSLRTDDDVPVRFSTPLPEVFPQRDVVMLPNGRVVSEHGWVVTEDDAVLLDTGFVHEEARFRYFETDDRLRPVTRVRGDVLALTSTWANLNYGHALLDAVSRLAIVRAAGLSMDRFDRFLVPRYPSPEVDFVLDRAGVPEDRRIRVDGSTNVEADRLWATGFPGVPRCYPPAVPRFLRSLLTDDEQGGDARVWLSRATGKRALRNHADAEALVRRHGFEPFDPRTDGNALLVLARASSVVGTHGAAMSSIAVAAAGARVTEILPSGHRYPYFATLAVSAGHDYRAVPATSVSLERDADFTVDLDRLEAALLAAG